MLYITQFEYIAITQLKLTSSDFWNLTMDRFYKLMACALITQKEQNKDLKKGNKLSPEEKVSLQEFVEMHKKRLSIVKK